MPVDFFDESLHEFFCIGLSERLLKIHDVTHHFCVEGDRVPHSLMKVKMGVMEESSSVLLIVAWDDM